MCPHLIQFCGKEFIVYTDNIILSTPLLVGIWVVFYLRAAVLKLLKTFKYKYLGLCTVGLKRLAQLELRRQNW